MGILTQIRPYAHWFLRFALASVFLYHGLTKFPVAAMMADMMQMPIMMVYLIALTEVSGGALILVGGLMKLDWATRIGGACTSVIMVGAISMVHWGQWGFMPSKSHPMGGMEFQVVLLCISLYFIASGNSEASNA